MRLFGCACANRVVSTTVIVRQLFEYKNAFHKYTQFSQPFNAEHSYLHDVINDCNDSTTAR